MGNKNNKSKKIPKFTIPSTLDELPVEIIYKILDELDICTIFASLHHVCKRFDEILSTYPEYHLNLKDISLRNFKIICSHIRPEQVTELTLFDDENNSELVKLFLSKFSINELVYLRSLTLIQINDEEFMNKILIAIPERSSLLDLSSIKIINTNETYGDIFIELIMPILTKPSLRKVYFDLSYSRTTSNPLPWIETSLIRHLTLNNTCTVNFVRNTLICVPDLETFTADDFDFDEETDLNYVPGNEDEDNDIDITEDNEEEAPLENPANNGNQLARKEEFASIESPNHLYSLILNACTISMPKFEWILQQMPTLKHIRLITTTVYDESILDGQRWENLLSNVNKFEFVFSVNMLLNSTWNIDTCITKFQTSFWTEKKRWFVALEKYDDEIILYTLPYRSKNFVVKNELTSYEYHSTAEENSLLRVQSMNNVQDLYIDVSNMKTTPSENTISPRFSHVTNLYLYGKWPKSKSFLTDIQIIVNLNHVEEFLRDECVPTMDFIGLTNLMPNLKSIKTTTDFLDALNAAKFCHTKCLRSFIIDANTYGDQRSVNIEPFCAMFPRIQKLIIPVDSLDSCRYALDQLNQDLISATFRIPVANDSTLSESEDETETEFEDENEEENPTDETFVEWTKELPEKYRCDKKQQQIYIRLK